MEINNRKVIGEITISNKKYPVTKSDSFHFHELSEEVIREALGKVRLKYKSKMIKYICKFNYVVGKNACVPTTEKDCIIFARRKGRKGDTRFVKNRVPEDCKSIVLILKQDTTEKYYILLTAFVGENSYPEPWDRFATEEAKKYWENHALVLDVFTHELE